MTSDKNFSERKLGDMGHPIGPNARWSRPHSRRYVDLVSAGAHEEIQFDALAMKRSDTFGPSIWSCERDGVIGPERSILTRDGEIDGQARRASRKSDLAAPDREVDRAGRFQRSRLHGTRCVASS